MRVWFNQPLGIYLALLLMHHQDGPFLRPSSPARKPSDPGLDPQSPAAAAAPPLSEERGDHLVLLEKIEAERDDSQTKGGASLSRHFPSSNVRGDGEGRRESTVGDTDGGVMESTGDSTTVWSSLELDMNYGHSHKGESYAHNSSALSSFFFVCVCKVFWN